MNILLIDIDTLRADHLGCYGYRKATSPFIDRLSAEGVTFDRCYAPGIPTTPAHTTLYTGQHPVTHGIVAHGGNVDIDRKTPVLPELLQRAGYTTCAVDNLFDIKPWLARGYEYYVNPSFHHPMRLLVSCEEINHRAIPWLKAHAAERFFLYVHYWEPHTPYLPPARYRRFYDGADPYDPANESLEPLKRTPFWRMWGDTWFKKLALPSPVLGRGAGGEGLPVTDAEYIVSLYDGEIAHVDDGVAQLIGALDELGLAEETLVVLTGDHGESMTEHGIYFDHHGLYEPTIRVPLILRQPGALPAGNRVADFVQQQDFAPTLLRMAGAEPPAGMDGADLLGGRSSAPSIGPDPTPNAQFPTPFIVTCECTWQKKWALRTELHKLILSREPDAYGTPMRELYDLQSDPAERHNLAEELPQLAADLELQLEGWIADNLRRAGRAIDPLMEQEITLGKRWQQVGH